MNIIKIEFKNQFKGLVIWALTTALILSFFISFFPSMKNSGMQELVGAKLEAIPESLRKAFNISSFTDFTDLLQYFAYCFQYIAIAGSSNISNFGSDIKACTIAIFFLFPKDNSLIFLFDST